MFIDVVADTTMAAAGTGLTLGHHPERCLESYWLTLPGCVKRALTPVNGRFNGLDLGRISIWLSLIVIGTRTPVPAWLEHPTAAYSS